MNTDPAGFDPIVIDGVSVLLLMLVTPLTSVGTTEEIAVLWWLGLVLLVVGAVTTLVTNFAFDRDR